MIAILSFVAIVLIVWLSFYLGTLEGNLQVYNWTPQERAGFFEYMDRKQGR